jgi:hypothetical protein
MTTVPTAAEVAPPRRGRRPPGFAIFLGRRLVALVLLAIGITAVTFVLTQLVPSNAVATNLGEQAAGDPAAVATFKHHYGLDKPLPERYVIYLGHLLHGDLGQSSLTHNSVRSDLTFAPGQLVGLRVGWKAGDSPPIEKLAAQLLTTTDAKQRQKLDQQFQTDLNTSGPYFPLMQPTQVFVSTSDLNNANAVFNAEYQVDVTKVTPK